MIEEKQLMGVGKFQRTHALKGELNAIIDIDPEYFTDDENPMIVEMDGCFVPFYIEAVRTKGSSSYLVKIERIDSEEQARQFVNKTIFVEREKLRMFITDEDEELVDSNDWEGFEIIDEELGQLGHLLRIDDSTVNILLVVETPDGQELYIPLAEEFIKAIDNEKRLIEMRLPEGLVELNKKKDE